jgi:hypothetical protein
MKSDLSIDFESGLVTWGSVTYAMSDQQRIGHRAFRATWTPDGLTASRVEIYLGAEKLVLDKVCEHRITGWERVGQTATAVVEDIGPGYEETLAGEAK